LKRIAMSTDMELRAATMLKSDLVCCLPSLTGGR
jgi:hypothetical protein